MNFKSWQSRSIKPVIWLLGVAPGQQVKGKPGKMRCNVIIRNQIAFSVIEY